MKRLYVYTYNPKAMITRRHLMLKVRNEKIQEVEAQ